MTVERLLNDEQSTSDPFAADLFFAGDAVARHRDQYPDSREPDRSITETSVDLQWVRGLKRITMAQARLSTVLTQLPDVFSCSAVSNALAHYTQTVSERVSITHIDLRESEPPAITSGPGRPYVYVSVVTGPEDALIVLETDAQFAAVIIDRMLGGDGTAVDYWQCLSRIEQALLEFLSLVLVREVNEQMGAPLIRLDSVSSMKPSVVHAEKRAGEMGEQPPTARELIATFNIALDTSNGLVRAYLGPDAVTDLKTALSTFGSRHPTDASNRARKTRRFAEISEDISLSIEVGRTDLVAGELAELECGDVVVIEHPSIEWVGQRVAGNLQVRVADGDQVLIKGRVVAAETRCPATASEERADLLAPQSINLMIQGASSGHAATLAERFHMEEKVFAETSASQGGEALDGQLLDGLLLTVHVELAARRIRLDELAQLRAGQILNLGCCATDPVDLVVEGRSVATGELVDIEGRLGVRITQVPR